MLDVDLSLEVDLVLWYYSVGIGSSLPSLQPRSAWMRVRYSLCGRVSGLRDGGWDARDAAESRAHVDREKESMMSVLHRQIQRVRPGKWADLEEIDKRFDVVERRLGFPGNKRRYRCYFGTHTVDTIVVEYEWESMAAIEAAYGKAMADTEWQSLAAEVETIIKSNQMELYMPLP